VTSEENQYGKADRMFGQTQGFPWLAALAWPLNQFKYATN